jgi:hypothetical protein
VWLAEPAKPEQPIGCLGSDGALKVLPRLWLRTSEIGRRLSSRSSTSDMQRSSSGSCPRRGAGRRGGRSRGRRHYATQSSTSLGLRDNGSERSVTRRARGDHRPTLVDDPPRIWTVRSSEYQRALRPRRRLRVGRGRGLRSRSAVEYVASADNGWLYVATYTLVSVPCSGRSSLQATNRFVEPNLSSSQAPST